MNDDVEISNTDVVDLRDLRSFLAVARTGSFTRAALELGYTQSAVSQHVASLEASVSRTLLLRRPVRLTPAGTRLAEHAAHIVLRLDVARSELALLEPEAQEIRIAMSPLATVGRVAAALRNMRSASPSVQIVLSTADASSAVAGVAEGRTDIAIVDGTVGPGNPLSVADAGLLTSYTVQEETVAVVVPSRHPMRSTTVELGSLVDAQWIHAPLLTAGPAGVPGLGLVVGEPRFTYDGADVATLLQLVASGHGLAMLPERVCAHTSGVRALRVTRPVLVHRTELLLLKSSVDRHRAIIEALRM